MPGADKIAIAIVGIGKIARDQHVPTIAHSGDFQLTAAASPSSRLDGVRCFGSIEELFAGVPRIDAVALCTTPQVRFETARFALSRGCHVLLEKPPGATLSEVQALIELAQRHEACLFAAWHSRYAAQVAPAREWLRARRLRSVAVTWKEDVRYWHPGQTWIWRAGGLGVFDPGINALSILTQLLPDTIVLREAELSYPANCETPIAARLQLSAADGTPISIELDFRHTGVASWDIKLETDAGCVLLSRGGSVMRIDAGAESTEPNDEYRGVYQHFASLVRERRIDADASPLRLVADAMLCGRRIEVEPFIE
ncbi:MAG TPA: Gfo/Idh/MocA family oxidoreductase [Steroidobacteraceae bacterium]|jgi:predicted dehydrogenase